MGRKTKRFYAVARGKKTGIFDKWYGDDGAEVQINGFPNACFKGFQALKQAKEWLREFSGKKSEFQAEINSNKTNRLSSSSSEKKHLSQSVDSRPLKEADKVIIFTDGGCINNPGPGGYGVILICGKHTKEGSGGFRLTTNNRMELMACIIGLGFLKFRCSVTIYTDSKYVVNGIKKGWAKRWRANAWMRNKTDYAENVDLWEQLLDFCDKHKVDFKWVRGHAGNPENEYCHQLAKKASLQKNLPRDTVYETGKTHVIFE